MKRIFMTQSALVECDEGSRNQRNQRGKRYRNSLWKRSAVCVTAMLGLIVSQNASADGITIDVRPSSAPNAYGSPSWAEYTANALNALENNLESIGNRETDPTAYEALGLSISPEDFMATSFKSWRGVANPPAPFANELGNRLYFGMHAYGDGVTQFNLEDLTFDLHSSDPYDSLQFTGNFIGYSYTGTTRYGIDWGTDRTKGGGDDIVYTSGNGTTLVDEIVYVGVGNAFWPGGDDLNPANPSGGAQAALDSAILYVHANSPFAITDTYEILGFQGSATVTATPEPATAMMAGMAGMLLWRKRRFDHHQPGQPPARKSSGN